jgi:hypothetical protein
VSYGYIQYKQLSYQEQSRNAFCCLLTRYNDIRSGGCPADSAEQLDMPSVFGSFWAMQKERSKTKPKSLSNKPLSIDYQ